MTTQTEELTISHEAVEQVSARFNEPEWLLRRRLEAWRLFEEAPMPDPLSEEWKRFDTDRLTLDGLAPFAEGASSSATKLHDELAGQIVQRNSVVAHRELDAALAAKGVVLLDLHAAAREHEAFVREHLESLVAPVEWKYLSLHGALWSGGCFVYVPAGVEVALPIEYLIELDTPGVITMPHLLIVAEANSKVTVIQESASPELGGLNVVSGAVEVVAREGAHVRFVDVQRWGRNVQTFATMRASLGKDASFQAILLGLGAGLTKARLDIALQEQGSRAELLGLFFGDGDQRFYYDTRQDHIAAKTESDLLFKAALDGHAGIVWEGVVDVRETAHQASANQTSRNLLLSDTASASPTPILEISAFDVTKCSHGATVGPVDDEQLFYLESRGIPPEEAERMLVEGFFNEVLERVPSEALRERVAEVLEQKRQAHG
jgi:Fe-S cluster assembly protein SufD